MLQRCFMLWSVAKWNKAQNMWHCATMFQKKMNQTWVHIMLSVKLPISKGGQSFSRTFPWSNPTSANNFAALQSCRVWQLTSIYSWKPCFRWHFPSEKKQFNFTLYSSIFSVYSSIFMCSKLQNQTKWQVQDRNVWNHGMLPCCHLQAKHDHEVPIPSDGHGRKTSQEILKGNGRLPSQV